ncbi:hypothetical protein C1I95_19620 [Micromonospora craterilacus]|uniref:Uncharacterized protein n=1 Tax=Micromonospora craterilacus TaxID=1655439 RepID=A0A2W2ESQ8_9ACTN|nr:hypothetical protein [Micromonospora craterilacus]PZG15418.1 hypothetical protein C1I95_19620 [Micromonospora craterilacus]
MAAVLDDFPVVVPVSDEDVVVAVRAVVKHAPERWPAGPLCRSERVPHPCRVARWGRDTLRAAGVADARVDELVAAGDPDAWVWA